MDESPAGPLQEPLSLRLGDAVLRLLCAPLAAFHPHDRPGQDSWRSLPLRVRCLVIGERAEVGPAGTGTQSKNGTRRVRKGALSPGRRRKGEKKDGDEQTREDAGDRRCLPSCSSFSVVFVRRARLLAP